MLLQGEGSKFKGGGYLYFCIKVGGRNIKVCVCVCVCVCGGGGGGGGGFPPPMLLVITTVSGG